MGRKHREVPTYYMPAYRVPSDADYTRFLKDPMNIVLDKDPVKNGVKAFYKSLRFRDDAIKLALPSVDLPTQVSS